MFANAIEKVGEFTRPIKFITRNYKETYIIPGAATLFFVNDEGCAITCKHVALELIDSEAINQKFQNFKAECAKVTQDSKRKAEIKKIEIKYGYNGYKGHGAAQVLSQFVGCTDSAIFEYFLHPDQDIAVLKFKDFSQTYYSGHAVFAKNGSSICSGDMLCRLGYPFLEFSNYQYNAETDEIEWNETGRQDTPRFPIEGMFTRPVVNEKGETCEIELSTPGLRGQSGGPLFDANGIIYGMQSRTMHFHLGFDMKNEKQIIDGKDTLINNQPFLHVGRCVNVNIIKAFLDEHNIKYYVGDASGIVEEING